MPDYILRPWQPEDRPQLLTLWKTAFGDTEEYIEHFFECFLAPGSCLVAEADGNVVSAMYILPGQTLYPYRKNVLTASYTYALATLPAYRGRGIGRAVYKAASSAALASADAACVLPAEEGLYPFYENATGAAPLSFIREARLKKSDLEGVVPCMAARIPILEYMGIREQLLRGLPHAALPPEFFELMEESDVEFFVLEHGLAAAEKGEDGVCRIWELLDPDSDDPMTSIAGVARWCRSGEYIVRTPLFFDGPGTVRPHVLAVLKETPSYPFPSDLWWGFGLE